MAMETVSSKFSSREFSFLFIRITLFLITILSSSGLFAQITDAMLSEYEKKVGSKVSEDQKTLIKKLSEYSNIVITTKKITEKTDYVGAYDAFAENIMKILKDASELNSNTFISATLTMKHNDDCKNYGATNPDNREAELLALKNINDYNKEWVSNFELDYNTIIVENKVGDVYPIKINDRCKNTVLIDCIDSGSELFSFSLKTYFIGIKKDINYYMYSRLVNKIEEKEKKIEIHLDKKNSIVYPKDEDLSSSEAEAKLLRKNDDNTYTLFVLLNKNKEEISDMVFEKNSDGSTKIYLKSKENFTLSFDKGTDTKDGILFLKKTTPISGSINTEKCEILQVNNDNASVSITDESGNLIVDNKEIEGRTFDLSQTLTKKGKYKLIITAEGQSKDIEYDYQMLCLSNFEPLVNASVNSLDFEQGEKVKFTWQGGDAKENLSLKIGDKEIDVKNISPYEWTVPDDFPKTENCVVELSSKRNTLYRNINIYEKIHNLTYKRSKDKLMLTWQGGIPNRDITLQIGNEKFDIKNQSKYTHTISCLAAGKYDIKISYANIAVTANNSLDIDKSQSIVKIKKSYGKGLVPIRLNLEKYACRDTKIKIILYREKDNSPMDNKELEPRQNIAFFSTKNLDTHTFPNHENRNLWRKFKDRYNTEDMYKTRYYFVIKDGNGKTVEKSKSFTIRRRYMAEKVVILASLATLTWWALPPAPTILPLPPSFYGK